MYSRMQLDDMKTTIIEQVQTSYDEGLLDLILKLLLSERS